MPSFGVPFLFDNGLHFVGVMKPTPGGDELTDGI
jgi:hypothetical protein